MPEKPDNKSKTAVGKEKMAVYFTPEQRQELDRWYKATDCRSRTEFIEQAVAHYIGELKMNETNPVLPVAVGAAIDGKLGSFEDRIARILFKQSVELDMLMHIVSNGNDWTPAEINSLRGQCVNEVRKTNGQIRFENVIAGEYTGEA